MKKHRLIIGICFGIFILIIGLISYSYAFEGMTEAEPVNISVIVYGSDAERWMNLKQGLEQAEKDYNVVVNFVTTSSEDSAGNLAGEQKELLQREIKNGADGLMIAASDSAILEETVAELIPEIPIVMIETGVDHIEVPDFLSADNYAMGKALAETLLEKEPQEEKIAVVCGNMARDSVKMRAQGFAETMKGKEIVYFDQPDGTFSEQGTFRSSLHEQKIKTVVAFDNSSLEALIDSVGVLTEKVNVYGIGNTDKIVYYLDKGLINSIVFQNEFSIGYLGAEVLYNRIEDLPEVEVPEISYRVIDRTSMYTKENQRLLFPLVQ